MANTPINVYVGRPSTNVDTLYTVPAGKTLMVTNIIIANQTTDDAALNLYFVPNASTPTLDNRQIPDVTIAGNNTRPWDLGAAVLSEGYTIQGQNLTAGAISLYISGYLKD